jgi:hypothetical protein
MVPGRIFFKRRLVGFLTALIAAVISIDCEASCRRAPLGGDKAAYFPAMAKRMAAVHGIGMKKIVQKKETMRVADFRSCGTASEPSRKSRMRLGLR